jgi:hypothetical protein
MISPLSLTSAGKIVRTNEKSGKRCINSYIMLHELGSGTFGKVRMCLHKETGEEMVCLGPIRMPVLTSHVLLPRSFHGMLEISSLLCHFSSFIISTRSTRPSKSCRNRCCASGATL